jgi:hypothetical protein
VADEGVRTEACDVKAITEAGVVVGPDGTTVLRPAFDAVLLPVGKMAQPARTEMAKPPMQSGMG